MRTIAAAVSAALLAALVASVPAPAQAKGRVGLVSAVGVTTSSVTLQWPKYRGARSYKVARATNHAMSRGVRVTRAKGRSVTFRRLASGREYCFVVRAYNARGKHIASSRRTCKPTAVIGVPAAGSDVAVLTYNVCSQACDTDAALRARGMQPWWARRGLVTGAILGSGADVVALQESTGWAPTLPADVGSVYGTVVDPDRPWAASILYRSSRFETVVQYSDVDQERREVQGFIDLGNNRRAIWALLRERATGRRLLVVSAHLTPDGPGDQSARRRAETQLMVQSVAAVNPGVPVVYAGDYNSNRARGDARDTVARVMNASGYVDAFDQARRLSGPNFNSANLGQLAARIGYTHGDHLDHVWVGRGDRVGVLSWANIAPRRGLRYLGPLGSDHSPILVTLRFG